jgi:ABC-type branched-subunit amino acid transport system substrate-binding protein
VSEVQGGGATSASPDGATPWFKQPWFIGAVVVAVVLALLAAFGVFGGEEEPVDEPEEPATEEPEEPAEEVEEEPAEEPEEPVEEEEAAPGESDGVLRLGYILPESGPLAFLGPPQIEAMALAVEDINAAGGVFGEDVTVSSGDEAGDATIAAESAQRLLGEGVDAIVGAAASGMSLSFVEAVTSAGVVQCSGSNTAPTFTDNDYAGLYFRTAPTDALQGPVLAETMIGDGATNPAILARADDYGQGLMDATVAELEAQGATVAAQITYDPEAANFEAEVNEAAASGADAVALIAFDEGAQILATMVEAGLGPDNLAVYGADGLKSNDLAGLVDPNDESILAGMRGTAPGGGEVSEAFLERYRSETGLEDTTFAAEVYDCTILIALAAIAADSDEGPAMGEVLVELTTGDTTCDSFEACRDALEAGESIAYQTASGVVLTRTSTGNGEPESGSYEVWEIDDTGTVNTVEVVTSSF